MSKALVYSLAMVGGVGGGVGGTLLISKMTSAYWEFKRTPISEKVNGWDGTDLVCGLLKNAEKSWLCVLVTSFEKLSDSGGGGQEIRLPDKVIEKPQPPQPLQSATVSAPASSPQPKWLVTLYAYDKDKGELWKMFENVESLESFKISKENGSSQEITPKAQVCKADCKGPTPPCCNFPDCSQSNKGWCLGEKFDKNKKENTDTWWRVSYLLNKSTFFKEVKKTPAPSSPDPTGVP